ncbi:HvfC/BufC N-terminal domain-containing protein [Roseibium limicola]|uniref:HvfC/BufC N-terminal domain-containing protein n=1 Tax=Roseibium limicola TaxID=2816037 RepID=UPI001AD930BE|nr:DNA-binding domain-containing protein [Roseibium limicola]
MPGDFYPPLPGRADFASALTDAGVSMPDGIIGPDGAPAPKRFNVYRNNVMSSLSEALAQSYPALSNLLGEDYFKAMARVLIAQHLPQSAVLLSYGAEMPEFIEAFPPLAAYPYLADVARLEWAWLRAYHASDCAPLAVEALSSRAPDQLGTLKLCLHPAAALISSRYPIVAILSQNRVAQSGRMDREAGKTSIDMSLSQVALVTRPDLAVHVEALDPASAVFFQALADGKALGFAAEHALAAHSDFDLTVCLRKVLETGAFIAAGGKA